MEHQPARVEAGRGLEHLGIQPGPHERLGADARRQDHRRRQNHANGLIGPPPLLLRTAKARGKISDTRHVFHY